MRFGRGRGVDPEPSPGRGTACAPPARPRSERRPRGGCAGGEEAAGKAPPRLERSPPPAPRCELLSLGRNQQIILGISQTGAPGGEEKTGERRGQGRTRWFFTLKIIYFMSQSLFVKSTNIQFGLA